MKRCYDHEKRLPFYLAVERAPRSTLSCQRTMRWFVISCEPFLDSIFSVRELDIGATFVPCPPSASHLPNRAGGLQRCFDLGRRHSRTKNVQVLSRGYMKDVPQKTKFGNTLSASRVPNNSWRGTSTTREYFFRAVLRILGTSSTSGEVTWGLGKKFSSLCFSATAKRSRECCGSFSRSLRVDPEVEVCFPSLSRFRRDVFCHKTSYHK